MDERLKFVVLLSYEDTDRLITRRLQILTQTHFARILEQHGVGVARGFVADFKRNLFRKTLTGLSQQGIVCWGRKLPRQVDTR